MFLFLVFTAVTPVFYMSPLKKSQDNLFSNLLFISIFTISLLFLLSKSAILLIFFYELLILPVFIILKRYGHYYRKIQASYFILIWALLGSIFIFIGYIFLFFCPGWDQEFFSLVDFNFYFWGIFFTCLGFLVKVPMWPFHYWISRAHAEGPSNLSIFLSGVLVKLSVYGIMRFIYLSPFKFNFTLFFYLSVIGVVDSTLKMLVQIDSKVVVAFSTTVQMNLISFIIFSFSAISFYTIKLGLLNHLLTASILFFFSDIILIRFNTREFFFITGLYRHLPVLSLVLVLFLINQLNFPGFLGFFFSIFFFTLSYFI